MAARPFSTCAAVVDGAASGGRVERTAVGGGRAGDGGMVASMDGIPGRAGGVPGAPAKDEIADA